MEHAPAYISSSRLTSISFVVFAAGLGMATLDTPSEIVTWVESGSTSGGSSIDRVKAP